MLQGLIYTALIQSFLLCFKSFKYIPKHKMVGTQRPTNIACCLSPLNHKASEKISEIKAATNSNLSAMVNLLNMLLFYFLLIWLFGFAPFLIWNLVSISFLVTSNNNPEKLFCYKIIKLFEI
jgi:hypothetical protein